jgi:hypothetical protein
VKLDATLNTAPAIDSAGNAQPDLISFGDTVSGSRVVSEMCVGLFSGYKGHDLRGLSWTGDFAHSDCLAQL